MYLVLFCCVQHGLIGDRGGGSRPLLCSQSIRLVLEIELARTQTETELLEILCDVEGLSFPLNMDEIRDVVLDSVQPGICQDDECNATTSRCEPDARDNWCHNCGGQTVLSFGELFMAVA